MMEKGQVLIKLTKSITKNMGNYNSARIEYGFEKVVDEADKDKELRKMSLEIDDLLGEEISELSSENA